MPPPLPERYHLEVRIGRDGDVEEWLATDEQLDRPVLVRVLGPESTPGRREAFLAHTRLGASVTHQYVARVYEVDLTEDGAYSVSEWPGGIRLADRDEAGLGVDQAAFLPNAEGLARGLGALHEVGFVHGAINASAVFFSAARPAKLAAFGRLPITTTAEADVRSLAAVLEESLTGEPAGTVPPSEMIDGVSTELDLVFETARESTLDAASLAERFAAVPAPTPPEVKPQEPGRRWWVTAIVLLVSAAALIAIGTTLAPNPPVVPEGSSPDSTTPDGAVTLGRVESFDPFGDGTENDRLLPNLVDGDPATAWTTEQYADPLPLIKAGVGITFEVSGTPSRLVLERMSSGTIATLHWRAAPSERLADWETLQRIGSDGTTIDVALPERPGGVWLLWLVDLPADGPVHVASIGEATFD